ncbi:MAG: 4-hydroxy-tetrahydrodipicolinate synthase [Aeromicrobium sp.]|nr:MAG: 4-hydroxy-tetrahydrodipicolinate synthase [Aeromicrobium sp.]
MTSPYATDSVPFGRVLTAMVTPFTPDGALDLKAAEKLATYLVDNGNDGLVVSGTTGESPTTTGEEDGRLLEVVLNAVGDRASVVAGVGTNDTRHSVELAKAATEIGAHGLLLVTPYYSKPPQAGIQAHIDAVVAAGGDTPVMLYDVPGRTVTKLSNETLLAADRHEQVVAIKDATADLARASWIANETSLAMYSGDDVLNLAWFASGAVGVVSVVGHVAAGAYQDMLDALGRGDLAQAQAISNRMNPLVEAIMGHAPGAISAKVALRLLGVLDSDKVRLPLSQAEDETVEIIRQALRDAGLLS